MFRALFPPARRPVTWRAVLPLALFLLLYLTAVLVLHFGGHMRFSQPWAFLFLLVSPWLWWMHHAGSGGIPGARGIAALVTRLAVFGIFVALLADPRAIRKSDTLSIIYALDLSDSVSEAVADQATEFMLNSVATKREKDEAGLVVFGRDAAVELPPRQSFPYETVNSQIPHDGTDIAKALSLSAAVVPDGNAGRIILVSDGGQTEGDLDPVLDLLKSRGIAVDVLPAHFDYEREVWLERLDLPRTVKSGETYEASVILSSLKSGTGTLVLEENGREVGREEVGFEPGKNRFTLPLYMRGPGYYEYTARILTEENEDGWEENNIAMGDIFLRGEGKVLLVTDPEGEQLDWEPIQSALKEGEHIVEVMDAFSFPRASIALLPYDAVIFANAPADAFDAVQLEAVRNAVYDQSTGFLMVGGANSFGPGGYHRTAVEEALPVSMDVTQKKVLPKGALAIILHTCEFAEGNTWGKRIAKEAIRVLGDKDEVGVLAYSYGEVSGDQWLFPLTPASEFEKLALFINAAQIGDMPSFAGTMQMGFNALKANDAAMKHMIIISDGDPSPPPPGLLGQFLAAKISVTTISIQPHGGQEVALMREISKATGGRYYFPKDPRQLPSIFIKEAKTLKRSMIQNVTFVPDVEFPSSILKGLDSLRELNGYVLTSPKDRAQVILKGPEKDEVAPVLATWRYGTGVAAAWTSDLSTNWAKSWVAWDKYVSFVKQLVTEFARPEEKSDLTAEAFATGGKGVISVEDASEEGGFMDVRATVRGPRGQSQTIALRQVGGRRYEVEFPLWGKGRYQVAIAGSGGTNPDGTPRSERAVSGFTLPYSAEYLDFRSDPITLKKIAEATGGRVLTAGDIEKNQLFDFHREPHRSSRSVIDWFLLTLIFLVPLDVGIRRIQIDWSVVRGWFGRSPQHATAAATGTMGALLKRKEKIQSDQNVPAPDLEIPSRSRPALPKKKAAPPTGFPADTTSPPPSSQDLENLSTTERLLARKRKRQQEKEE